MWNKPMLWVKICWIRIRIQAYRWIHIQIRGQDPAFFDQTLKIFLKKTIFAQKLWNIFFYGLLVMHLPSSRRKSNSSTSEIFPFFLCAVHFVCLTLYAKKNKWVRSTGSQGRPFYSQEWAEQGRPSFYPLPFIFCPHLVQKIRTWNLFEIKLSLWVLECMLMEFFRYFCPGF